jgi:dTDP-4-dehydrorhamnose reductase
MLGHALMPVLEEKHEVAGLSRRDCDLCDERAVQEVFRLQRPDLVVHLAAWTDVDGCEREPQKATAWNEAATFHVARAAKQIGAAVLFVSTDYVFDGRATQPYPEEAQPNPLNVYGKTKLKGEEIIAGMLDRYFIVRTSWLFGPDGKNFVTTILRLVQEQSELRVVNDQRGSPTYTRHLARKLAELATTNEYGTYHITGDGDCTWFEFARKIIELAAIEGVQVLPISSAECGRPALRPAYSVLANRKLSLLGMGLLPHWKAGLKSYLEEISNGGHSADKTRWKRTAYPQPA